MATPSAATALKARQQRRLCGETLLELRRGPMPELQIPAWDLRCDYSDPGRACLICPQVACENKVAKCANMAWAALRCRKQWSRLPGAERRPATTRGVRERGGRTVECRYAPAVLRDLVPSEPRSFGTNHDAQRSNFNTNREWDIAGVFQ
eukprot:s8034_g3.t1